MTIHPLNDLYNERFDFPIWDSVPISTMMIATIPRTGSTYLAVELWRRGVFGAPMEYLNLHNRLMDMVPRLGNNDVTQYWQELQRKRTSENGVFSFKAFASDFADFGRRFPQLMPLVKWDKIVYLTRRDKLAQALSYARAFQTKQWFSGQRGDCEPEYDRSAIDKAMEWVSVSEAAWELIFSRNSYSPLRIFYEDVQDDINKSISGISSFMNIHPANSIIQHLPTNKIQRDNVTDEWRKRYIDDQNSLVE
jgi:LPS sulfotransferase NodH